MPDIDVPLEQQLSSAAERVRDGIRDAVATLVPVTRPADLQRALKLDRTFTSRLLRSLDLDDPLAALQSMPGPKGIRQFLRAVAKTAHDQEPVVRAEEALGELEQLVRREIGEWNALDAVLCGWLPEVRGQFEMTNRQMAFRAMSNIKGVLADTGISTTLIYPCNEDVIGVDAIQISGLCRFRRLRVGCQMLVPTATSFRGPAGTQPLSLDANSIDRRLGLGLLKEFSSSPAPNFSAYAIGETERHAVEDDGIGAASALDLYFAHRTHGLELSCKPNGCELAVPCTLIETPLKSLVVDVLLHDDVRVRLVPELLVYDACVRGVGDRSDFSGDVDHVKSVERTQCLGGPSSGFRMPEVQQYLDMLRLVCESAGLESERFRGYRYRVQYPIYGSQVSLVFKPVDAGAKTPG